MKNKLAVVRLRGSIGVRREVLNTLKLMGLERVNTCVLMDGKPASLGMLRKVKDYVTWGLIEDKTFKLLTEKREAAKGSKGAKVFRLRPAKGGLGRRGIKAAFSAGGALGNRKEKINELLKRMM